MGRRWPISSRRTTTGSSGYRSGFTLKYTVYITPILMIGGYLIALLVARNTPLRRVTRAVVFVPVVIGLGVSSLLWYWLFSYDFGLVNRLLVDLGSSPSRSSGSARTPTARSGRSSSRSCGRCSASACCFSWRRSRRSPSDVTEAAMVDGASYWQRVRMITLPLTYKTILLVTLVSVIGSLLAFDQFFLMTAGQPFNRTASSVFWIYLNSFPYLKLGYGAALSLVLAVIVLALTIVQAILTQRSRS